MSMVSMTLEPDIWKSESYVTGHTSKITFKITEEGNDMVQYKTPVGKKLYHEIPGGKKKHKVQTTILFSLGS